LLAVVGVIVVAVAVAVVGVGGSCRGSSDCSRCSCVRLYMCQSLWECPSSGHSRGALVAAGRSHRASASSEVDSVSRQRAMLAANCKGG
jgi:hypothetical protein